MTNSTEKRVELVGNLQDVFNVFDKITNAATDLKSGEDVFKQYFAGMQGSAKDMYKGMMDASKDARLHQIKDAENLKKTFKSKFEDINASYTDMISDMRKSNIPLIGSIGEIAPASIKGVSGLQSGISALKGSILSELPFGGLVGVMMYGAMRQAEVEAQGVSVMRMFQQSGQVAKGELGSISEEARKLGVDLGKGPTGMFGEFQAAAAQFAQSGIDSSDVLKEINLHGSETGESLLTTSIRLDSLFKTGAGTSARMMSQMIRDFNLEGTESAKVVAGIGLAARDSGTSVTAFMTSVMRSSAAMRTMRVDITEVAEAQLKFAEIAKTTLGGQVSDQFAAAYAERATQQVTSGLSGMGVGMSAVLAERISERGALGKEEIGGLDAYYAFKEGFQGEGQQEGKSGIFNEGIKELLTLAGETGGTESEQRYFLEKQGMGFEGSKVLMEIKGEMDAGNSIDKAIEKHQAALNDSFTDRAKETSIFQKSMMKIQDELAKLGVGLLGVTIAGFEILAGLLAELLGYEAFSKRMIESGTARFDASTDMMKNAAEGMLGGAEMGLGGILNAGGGRIGSLGERTEASVADAIKIKKDVSGGLSNVLDTAMNPIDALTESLSSQLDYAKKHEDRDIRNIKNFISGQVGEVKDLFGVGSDDDKEEDRPIIKSTTKRANVKVDNRSIPVEITIRQSKTGTVEPSRP